LRGRDGEWSLGVDAAVKVVVEAEVLEELPSLLYRLATDSGQRILGHAAGGAEKNFIRLVPGDRVEVELAPGDPSRGRISKRLTR